ncbi:benzoylformate decarboxylase [Nocardia transvalensis]|uniref:benzoylformate decarboxylase n=1 Tax=Nocardia transvalensis TaxID=37333 RepID=UPI001895D04A|nr:benzoylformate decarboxylase [Nocardia transvalensis]MBF6328086.1 benzoylformate decarboxylase [Nocardia transvalensis]
MTTVRDASYEVLRSQGVTTFFGNPGSNELPFLQGFPDDFRYILALQEGAGLAMADGYAQAARKPVLVSLHAAAGVGQAMGNLVNSWQAGTPLVLLSGQQYRPLITLQGMLTNHDATTLPRPLVKWSFEAPSPQAVPAALTRAIACATTTPTGPVYLSVPLSDWDEPADTDNLPYLLGRRVAGRPVAEPEALQELARRLDAAENPVLVLGPDVDAYGGWNAAVALAEKAGLPVQFGTYEYPRISFPTQHPCYRGTLGAMVGQVREQLAPYDFVAWIGGAVLPYHAWQPGRYLREGTELVLVTADPDQAARSPLGAAIVGDPAEALARLTGLVTVTRPLPEPRKQPAPVDLSAAGTGTVTEAQFLRVLAEHHPDDTAWVFECPSLGAWWDILPITRPNSFFCAAASALGYGLPAAVGVALAQPDRPVIAMIGDGSANYSITGLWSAARHHLDITYLILHNGAYRVLEDYGTWLGADKLPGLDLPGIDFVDIATGYGIPARTVTTPSELADALKQAFGTPGPHLIQVRTTNEPSGVFR